MKITELINNQTTAFSFEILPPVKGSNINKAFQSIEALKEFNPKYINITTHRSEVVCRTLSNGEREQYSVRHRPGTVAIAAAIQNKYKIPVVPHIICSGFTKSETEYALIDLAFLDIENLLVLRGDKAKGTSEYELSPDSHDHAIDLQAQINDFNKGRFIDDTTFDKPITPFSYGIAGYPEKHEDAPNFNSDIFWLKEKVKAGAEYIVTQMFFDNSKYFAFVARCRTEGITVPIIPGLKPMTLTSQLDKLPHIFHLDIPEEFAKEMRRCKTREESSQLGVEWCIAQAKELKEKGVPSIHFYSLNAVESVKKVAEKVY
ncbi:MAG: methylenetetrahydrofolate reductase [NAD(P)H] [Prevotellaceae bacterium]|jgi:methylenetetrahydrofolate reductase (NADPH)|nr:methylenetetrahydrofolate reductase [NAD(P)H] [Prevotellaceae bacterium]